MNVRTMSSRREIILQAMLELVAERGLQDAPMSLVVKRSGASAGIIYHYFASKDELLIALYVQVKKKLAAAIDAATAIGQPPQQAFERMWLDAYRFFAEHQQETLFIYQFEGAPGYKTPELTAQLHEEPEYVALLNWFGSESVKPLLKDLPTGIIYELSFAIAARLSVRREPLEEKAQREVALSCWQAITH